MMNLFFRTPFVRKMFCDAMDRFTGIPFYVEPSSHLHLVNEFILNALQIAFPRERPQKVKSFISESTYKLICVNF